MQSPEKKNYHFNLHFFGHIFEDGKIVLNIFGFLWSRNNGN